MSSNKGETSPNKDETSPSKGETSPNKGEASPNNGETSPNNGESRVYKGETSLVNLTFPCLCFSSTEVIWLEIPSLYYIKIIENVIWETLH